MLYRYRLYSSNIPQPRGLCTWFKVRYRLYRHQLFILEYAWWTLSLLTHSTSPVSHTGKFSFFQAESTLMIPSNLRQSYLEHSEFDVEKPVNNMHHSLMLLFLSPFLFLIFKLFNSRLNTLPHSYISDLTPWWSHLMISYPFPDHVASVFQIIQHYGQGYLWQTSHHAMWNPYRWSRIAFGLWLVWNMSSLDCSLTSSCCSWLH